MRYHKEFFLSSSIPALLVGVTGTVIATWLLGKDGLVAGLFAIFLVFIFLVVHLIVAIVAPRVSPMATMGLAMASYFVKIALLILCLFSLNPIEMDRRAFGVIAIATTIAWLAGEIWAFSTAWTRRRPRRPIM